MVADAPGASPLLACPAKEDDIAGAFTHSTDEGQNYRRCLNSHIRSEGLMYIEQNQKRTTQPASPPVSRAKERLSIES